MFDIDTIMAEFYWALRMISLYEVDAHHLQLVKDIYMGCLNAETFYTHDAGGFFPNETSKKIYYIKYIKPLEYSLKVLKKIPHNKFPLKSIKSFLKMYGSLPPKISWVKEECDKAGLRAPKDLEYRISREWATYPKAVNKLGRGIIVEDLKMKESTDGKK